MSAITSPTIGQRDIRVRQDVARHACAQCGRWFSAVHAGGVRWNSNSESSERLRSNTVILRALKVGGPVMLTRLPGWFPPPSRTPISPGEGKFLQRGPRRGRGPQHIQAAHTRSAIRSLYEDIWDKTDICLLCGESRAVETGAGLATINCGAVVERAGRFRGSGLRLTQAEI